ncbi:Striatin, partial [Trichinella papuae]
LHVISFENSSFICSPFVIMVRMMNDEGSTSSLSADTLDVRNGGDSTRNVKCEFNICLILFHSTFELVQTTSVRLLICDAITPDVTICKWFHECKCDKDDKASKPPYSIPGVLHFIQHEWVKFEMDRSQWEVEKAELLSRIAFLQGERKGQENLKNDLVRRIKMLEYALKLERAKNQKLLHGEAKEETEEPDAAEYSSLDNQIPNDLDAVPANQTRSGLCWRKGRLLLKQYLQEIGYTDTILDVKNFRIRSLLGLNPEAESNLINDQSKRKAEGKATTENSVPVVGGGGGAAAAGGEPLAGRIRRVADKNDGIRRDEGDSAPVDMELSNDEEEALAEFKFLPGNEYTDSCRQADVKQSSGDEWTNVDYQEIDKKKSEFQKESLNKKGTTTTTRVRTVGLQGKELDEMISALYHGDDDGATADGGQNVVSGNVEANVIPPQNLPKQFFDTEFAHDLDTALCRIGNLPEVSKVGAGYDESDLITHDVKITSEESLRKTWNNRITLRGHFDSVRAIAFHPVDPVIVSASEDGTVKLWNLQKALVSSGTIHTTVNSKSSSQDLEPVYTFRGHEGPVLCMCLSPTGDYCYTGGLDGTVRSWLMPPPTVDLYDSFDKSYLPETLLGHDDAVWSVAFHSSDNRLVSASADGTLKLWEPSSSSPLLATYTSNSADGVPTSVDFVNADPQQAVAAFKSGAAYVYDLETSKIVLSFEISQDSSSSRSSINQILSHPTLPITITAHDDRVIRFFDNNTGQMIDSVVAHLDAVTCLSIDPNGLYLLSGSHDGSLRLWNVDTKMCLQETTAHRKKFDASLHAVAFHASRPMIASAGADGLTKIFMSSLYWSIESLLMRMLCLTVTIWLRLAHIEVYEQGDDVKQYVAKRCLVLVNHQSTADVPILFDIVNMHFNKLYKVVWVLDNMFRCTPFGLVCRVHGDLFIREGLEHRDRSLQKLQNELRRKFWSRRRNWIIVFPEGGFLYKRIVKSQNFAKANNLPVFHHVVVPRVGCIRAVLEVCNPLKDLPCSDFSNISSIQNSTASSPLEYLVDITIAYENGNALSLWNIATGLNSRTKVILRYKCCPISDMPRENSDTLLRYLCDRWQEKEIWLQQMLSGSFSWKETVQRRVRTPMKYLILSQLFLSSLALGIES